MDQCPGNPQIRISFPFPLTSPLYIPWRYNLPAWRGKMVHFAIRNLPICFSINPERRPCRLRIARPTHGMRLAVRLRSCLKLNATQPVPSRHVSHALHLSHFSRKRPALLQGCRIPGIQCGRPVLRTCKIQPHIWRTSGSFFSHCRNFGTLNSNRGWFSPHVRVRRLAKLSP